MVDVYINISTYIGPCRDFTINRMSLGHSCSSLQGAQLSGGETHASELEDAAGFHPSSRMLIGGPFLVVLIIRALLFGDLYSGP